MSTTIVSSASAFSIFKLSSQFFPHMINCKKRSAERRIMSEQFTVYAVMKKLGKQKKESLVPVPFVLDERPQTVRDLIEGLVKLGVKEYNERKDNGQILPYLTKEEIRDRASAGKVAFGVRGGNDASEEEAVTNAIQSFEDGIYRVFAGEEEMTGLDEAIPWKEGLTFTFIRLTMLAGW